MTVKRTSNLDEDTGYGEWKQHSKITFSGLFQSSKLMRDDVYACGFQTKGSY